jgi:small subunit ribosomal protein S7e
MSQPAINKIAPNSPSRQSPSELETSIATALYELETNIPDLKASLRPLQFVSAREVCYPLTLPAFEETRKRRITNPPDS